MSSDDPVATRQQSPGSFRSSASIAGMLSKDLRTSLKRALGTRISVTKSIKSSRRGIVREVFTKELEEMEAVASDEFHSGKKTSYHKATENVVSSRWFTGIVHLMTLVSAVELGIPADKDSQPRLVVDNMVTAVFACELVLKCGLFRHRYFQDAWNGVDAIVTTISVVDAWVLPNTGAGAGNALGSVEIFRVFRICRIFRFIGSVHKLRVLMESLISSIYALIWIVMLLILMLYAFAIVSIELIGADENAYPGFDNDFEWTLSKQVTEFNNYEYFGTLPRSMMTLFNVAMVADWTPLRPVLEYQIWVLPLLLFVICITSFALVNVIMGVIMDRTSRLLQDSYREEADVLKLWQMDCLSSMAEQMMDQNDTNMDGVLSMRELEDLNVAGIDLLDDADFPKGFTTNDLFVMLNLDGDDNISKDEWVTGMHRLIFSNDFQKTCLALLGQGHLRQMQCTMQKNVDERFLDLHATVNAIFSELQEIKCLLGAAQQSPSPCQDREESTPYSSRRERGLEPIPSPRFDDAPRSSPSSNSGDAWESLQHPADREESTPYSLRSERGLEPLPSPHFDDAGESLQHPAAARPRRAWESLQYAAFRAQEAARSDVPEALHEPSSAVPDVGSSSVTGPSATLASSLVDLAQPTHKGLPETPNQGHLPGGGVITSSSGRAKARMLVKI